MKLATSLSQEDEALFDLIHPLAESSLLNWIGQELQHQQFVEFLPIGQSFSNRAPLLQTNYAVGGGTQDVEWRSSSTAIITAGNGTEFLQLENTPVSLTGLQVKENPGGYAGQAEGSFGDDTVLALGVDYYLDVDNPASDISKSGILYRNGSWPTEPRSIKVSYFGGYTAQQLSGNMAGVVKLAAMQCIAAAFWKAKVLAKTNGLGPYTSESIGKYSYAISSMASAGHLTFDVPADARRQLFSLKSLGRIFG